MKRFRSQFEVNNASAIHTSAADSPCYKRAKLEEDAFGNSSRVDLATKPRVCGTCKCVVTASQANHDECLNELLSPCGAAQKNLTAIRRALYFAIGKGNLNCVRLLLDYDVEEVNRIQHTGVTPLHMSAGAGQVEVMKELIRRGADIHLQLKRDHLTPLHICASFGSVDCLRFLLQAGADPLQQTSESSMNALHFAAHGGHIDCVRALIAHGCDVNAVSHSSHRSALHFALCRGELECFQLLVAAGADLTLTDINGHSALFCLPLDPVYLDSEVIRFFSLPERKRWFTYILVDVEKRSLQLHDVQRGHLVSHLQEHFQEVIEGLALTPNAHTMFERLPFFEVTFAGELGRGAGVRREWFSMLSTELLDHPTFESCASGKINFTSSYDSKSSSARDDILLMAAMAGVIFALALTYGHSAPFEFPPHVYKALLGESLSVDDVVGIDEELYENKFQFLQQRMDSPLLAEELEDLQLYFTRRETKDDGTCVEIDLIPGGSMQQVDAHNLPEYLRLCSKHLFGGVVLERFVQSFHRCVPQKLLQALFTTDELISSFQGERCVRVDEWQKNTTYMDCSPSDPQIQWFWKFVQQLTTEEQSLLLSFCTGSRSLPLGGFERLNSEQIPFTIHVQSGLPVGALPTSHTCFNTLVFPRYENCDVMKSKLQLVLQAQASGVGFSFV